MAGGQPPCRFLIGQWRDAYRGGVRTWVWIVVFCLAAACVPADQRTTTSESESPRQNAAAPTEVSTPDEARDDLGRQPRRLKGERRPAWLGQRELPRRPDGYGEIRPTPRVLRDRRLRSVEHLPPPPSGRFRASVSRPPRAVLERSTWSRRCPVARSELRYVRVVFHGFDEQPHTGELLVHADVAANMVDVFRALYRARFPIEEMRVVDGPELDLPPTGDGNNTTAFVCRPSRGATSWSQHAYGLAVDVNPFHNPYVKDDVVLPELASSYTRRAVQRPGMHQPGGVAVRAFAAIGWEWGGHWSSLKDYMHFSRDNR